MPSYIWGTQEASLSQSRKGCCCAVRHSRNVGKTSVVAGIIAALPQMNWTAAKITQFGHGVCSVSAEPCECALNETEHSWSVDEEFDRGGESDTSRFLLAGAKKVLWVRTK